MSRNSQISCNFTQKFRMICDTQKKQRPVSSAIFMAALVRNHTARWRGKRWSLKKSATECHYKIQGIQFWCTKRITRVGEGISPVNWMQRWFTIKHLLKWNENTRSEWMARKNNRQIINRELNAGSIESLLADKKKCIFAVCARENSFN